MASLAAPTDDRPVSTAQQQHADDGRLTVGGRSNQGRVAGVVPRIDVRAEVEKQQQCHGIASLRREHEGRSAVSALRIYVHTPDDQLGHDLRCRVLPGGS